MNSFFKYFADVFSGVKSLLVGMSVTGRYFFSPAQIVTEQYPENRKKLKMQERFKGEVIMVHNQNNQHRCNGCGICETSCPNGSIEILSTKIDGADGKKVRIIDKHIYHLSMCTFCGLCIKNCPSNALAWGQQFEHAVFDRAMLTKILNQPGSSIQKGIEE
jgi:NADH-quinone oxidoreductase subunit I